MLSAVVAALLLFNSSSMYASAIEASRVEVSHTQVNFDMNKVDTLIKCKLPLSVEEELLSSVIIIDDELSTDFMPVLKKLSMIDSDSYIEDDTMAYSDDNYTYLCKYEDNMLYQWVYFSDGTVRKTVSVDEGDITYLATNTNNEIIEFDNNLMHDSVDSLSEDEINKFNALLENEAVPVQETYSTEEVRSFLNDTEKQVISYNNSSEIAHYASTTCYKNVYATGSSYKDSPTTKPITAHYIGSKCSTIKGLSKYHNDSDTAEIKLYDTRYNYIEESKTKSFFKKGSTVESLVSYAKLAFDKTVDVLGIFGVIIDAGLKIEESIYYFKDQKYQVNTLREATIYDYTKEKAYVELPQIFSAMEVGYVSLKYDAGVYHDMQWAVLTPPKYNIPSRNITDATKQQYADYVADMYYRVCVINGKWIHGRTCYNGLGK